MTFAIVGRCRRTGMLGVGVTTSSIAVGSRCPWVRAGVGAVTAQNFADPDLGPRILDLLAGGLSARDALTRATADAAGVEFRQLAVVDARGGTAHFSGANTLKTNTVAEGKDCVVPGNLLANLEVPAAAAAAFEMQPDLHLAERLIVALRAGLDAGGEEGPVRSAALLVADVEAWPLVNLRVDWNDDDERAGPVGALYELWNRFEPEMNDYLLRAVAPDDAPGF